MMMAMRRTATTKQVAAMLGVKETTVQLYSRQNRIPFDRTPGGHRRYDLAEVRTALGYEGVTSALAPMASTGLGVGTPVTPSAMAAMDAARRAVIGDMATEAEHHVVGRVSAALALFEHPRRVLVAV